MFIHISDSIDLYLIFFKTDDINSDGFDNNLRNPLFGMNEPMVML